jgi:hypothetical protein
MRRTEIRRATAESRLNTWLVKMSAKLHRQNSIWYELITVLFAQRELLGNSLLEFAAVGAAQRC